MALTIYMCGHGAWNGGFVQLPADTTMTMFTDVNKVLFTTDMYKLCGGTYTGEPARVIGEAGTTVRTCPDMVWTADKSVKIVECDKRLASNPSAGNAVVLFPNHLKNHLDNRKSITLKKFFSAYWPTAWSMLGRQPVNFMWCCCAYVKLKGSKAGAELGVNAAQTAGGHSHIDWTSGDPILTGKFTKI